MSISDQFACQYTQGFFSQITVGQYFESVAGNHVSIDGGASIDVKTGLAVEGTYGGVLGTNASVNYQVNWGPKFSLSLSEEVELAESNTAYYENSYYVSVGATAIPKVTYKTYKFWAKATVISQLLIWYGTAATAQTAFGIGKTDNEVSTGDIDANVMKAPSWTAVAASGLSFLTLLGLLLAVRQRAKGDTPTGALYVKDTAGCYFGAKDSTSLSEFQVSPGRIRANHFRGSRNLPTSTDNASSGDGTANVTFAMNETGAELNACNDSSLTLKQVHGSPANSSGRVLLSNGAVEIGAYNSDCTITNTKLSILQDAIKAEGRNMVLSLNNNSSEISAVNNNSVSLVLSGSTLTGRVGGHQLSISEQAITLGNTTNKISINQAGVTVTNNFKILEPNGGGASPNVYSELLMTRTKADQANQKALELQRVMDDRLSLLNADVEKKINELTQNVDEKVNKANQALNNVSIVI